MGCGWCVDGNMGWVRRRDRYLWDPESSIGWITWGASGGMHQGGLCKVGCVRSIAFVVRSQEVRPKTRRGRHRRILELPRLGSEMSGSEVGGYRNEWIRGGWDPKREDPRWAGSEMSGSEAGVSARVDPTRPDPTWHPHPPPIPRVTILRHRSSCHFGTRARGPMGIAIKGLGMPRTAILRFIAATHSQRRRLRK